MKSKRNLVVGLLLAGAAVIALGSVAVASGGHKGKDNDRHAKKIVVVERATTDTAIDNAPVGVDSIGDTLAFGNQLFDKTNTMMVGTDQGSCVRTVPGVAFECTWSNSLKGGQIMVRGPVPRRRRLRARHHRRHRQVPRRHRDDGPARDRRDVVHVHVPHPPLAM